MPITQNKLREVLLAGKDYQLALRRAIFQVGQAHGAAMNGADPAMILASLAATCQEKIILQDPNSAAILAITEDALRRNWRENEKDRQKKAEKRKQAGAIPMTRRELEEFPQTPSVLPANPFLLGRATYDSETLREMTESGEAARENEDESSGLV